MTKKPIINALLASIYIMAIALIMYYGSKIGNPPDSVLAPVAVISLFTLSAAVMGYLFLYTPIQLYFDNHKKEAVRLFLQTVATFGLITLIILATLFFRVLV